jgi:hypothetical protein
MMLVLCMNPRALLTPIDVPDPAAHGLVRNLHTEAAEDLCLPVHRQVVSYFADHHLRQ